MRLLVGDYSINTGGAASIRGNLKFKEPPLKPWLSASRD
jgi:hypothetical protein